MLAYLDAMIAALSVRDRGEVEHLLAHPLARILSDAARTLASLAGSALPSVASSGFAVPAYTITWNRTVAGC